MSCIGAFRGLFKCPGKERQRHGVWLKMAELTLWRSSTRALQARLPSLRNRVSLPTPKPILLTLVLSYALSVRVLATELATTQRPWPLQQKEKKGKEWLFIMLPLDLDSETEALALALANLRCDHQGPRWRSDGLPWFSYGLLEVCVCWLGLCEHISPLNHVHLWSVD
jgi:hypothetical protein